ncbi:MAG: hypothetical protein KKD18_02590 [Nanoarchaeota archaeon]|nr:hypothetical protein [Nanoarchaeota archaeon]MBU0977279.1 hypothetical protein [Nanoarchaeota archaeon]
MISRSYRVEGGYQFRGREERQEGRITLAPNRILYGQITDLTTSGRSPKNVLGLQFTQDNALGILKVSNDLTLCPILWYLRPTEQITSSDSLSGNYRGVWGTAQGAPMDILQVITSNSGQITSENIRDLGPTELEMAFFQRDFLDQMEAAARRAEQTGTMRFTLSV